MSGAIRHVTVRGRVQGVGYRAWVEHQAIAHDLEGWVRNRRDGTVEAVIAGPAAEVAAMIEALRRGPPSAHVQSLEARAADAAELALREAGEAFSQLPTA
jgi:acylphosphatase